MIEITRHGKNPMTAVLTIDGESFPGDMFVDGLSRANAFRVSVDDEDISAMLLNRTFSEFSKDIAMLDLFATKYSLIANEPEITQTVTVYRDEDGALFISLNFEFPFDDWKRLWSISEYRKEFNCQIQDQGLNGLRTLRGFSANDLDLGDSPAYDDLDIHLLLPVREVDAAIDPEVRKNSGTINHLHRATENALMSKIRSESVVLQFEFAADVRVACEQYLLYFVQFLKDLGVDATAELQHYAGDVLFAVTPTDKNEALDKIRIALETYLRLPMNDFSGGGETSITVQRLASNIYHLRGQLALAQAVLEAKDATIQSQRVTINQRSLPQLDGEIMVSSIKEGSVRSAESNREEVLDGMAEITKYEGKGFAVNLPEIYRRLKRLFDERD